MALLRQTSLVAAAALVLGGTAFGALTPTAYRAQANAACAKAKVQSKALGQLVNPTTAEVTKSIAAGLAIGRQEYASLGALQPPGSLATAHQRALGLMSQELSLITNELQQIQAGTDWVKAMSVAGRVGLPLALRASAAWGAAGVAACSGGGLSVHVP